MLVVVEGESLRVGDLRAAPSVVSYLSVDPGCSTNTNRTGARSTVSTAERAKAAVTSLTETTVSGVPLEKTIEGTLDIVFADRSSVSGTFELPVCHAEAFAIEDPCR